LRQRGSEGFKSREIKKSVAMMIELDQESLKIQRILDCSCHKKSLYISWQMSNIVVKKIEFFDSRLLNVAGVSSAKRIMSPPIN
jgi:hypothetical protein